MEDINDILEEAINKSSVPPIPPLADKMIESFDKFLMVMLLKDFLERSMPLPEDRAQAKEFLVDTWGKQFKDALLEELKKRTKSETESKFAKVMRALGGEDSPKAINKRLVSDVETTIDLTLASLKSWIRQV